MVGTLDINNAYMEMLGSLSNEDKLDLISKLVKSMKKAVTKPSEPADTFAGFSRDWGDGMTTEEYADMLRQGNVEN